MRAAEALRTAWPAGVETALDGDDLVLDASSPPPEPVLDARRPEAELRTAFDAVRPRILGVLIEAVVQELRMLPDTKLKRLPPLGGFCPMGISLRGRDLAPGTFWSAYCGNRDEAIENVIEADPGADNVSPRAMDETQADDTGPVGPATALQANRWPTEPLLKPIDQAR